MAIEPQVLNIKEAMAYIKFGQGKLRKLVKQKKIPFFRNDSRILFRRASLDAWLVEQEKAAADGE